MAQQSFPTPFQNARNRTRRIQETFDAINPNARNRRKTREQEEQRRRQGLQEFNRPENRAARMDALRRTGAIPTPPPGSAPAPGSGAPGNRTAAALPPTLDPTATASAAPGFLPPTLQAAPNLRTPNRPVGIGVLAPPVAPTAGAGTTSGGGDGASGGGGGVPTPAVGIGVLAPTGGAGTTSGGGGDPGMVDAFRQVLEQRGQANAATAATQDQAAARQQQLQTPAGRQQQLQDNFDRAAPGSPGSPGSLSPENRARVQGGAADLIQDERRIAQAQGNLDTVNQVRAGRTLDGFAFTPEQRQQLERTGAQFDFSPAARTPVQFDAQTQQARGDANAARQAGTLPDLVRNLTPGFDSAGGSDSGFNSLEMRARREQQAQRNASNTSAGVRFVDGRGLRPPHSQPGRAGPTRPQRGHDGPTSRRSRRHGRSVHSAA